MAEKRKPTYDLDALKASFSSAEKLNLTGTAVRTAAALGFGTLYVKFTADAITEFLLLSFNEKDND